MITTSQKARLCEMAQQLKPIFEIGKNGIGEKEIIDISMPTDNNTNVAKTQKGANIQALKTENASQKYNYLFWFITRLPFREIATLRSQ